MRCLGRWSWCVTDSRPVGVFDSGVGGLTVLRAIHDMLPNEATIYLGDLAFFPYGPKSRELVRDRSRAIARYLLSREVKAIVVACNTATSAALSDIAELAPCPVIGVVEPGAAAAVKLSGSKVIGVLATEGTTRSAAYRRAVEMLCPEATIVERACGLLVGLIEEGAGGSDSIRDVVSSSTAELIEGHGCDTIILGCTHFPLVRDEFERAAGESAAIVDSASTTARALASMLTKPSIAATVSSSIQHEFLVTSQAGTFVTQARNLFGEQVEAVVVDLPSRSLEPVAR
jgi:glutamate racemase